MNMQKPISIRISDDIQALVATPLPVVALNLMGLSMLGSKNLRASKVVFWSDGIFGSLACLMAGLSVKRIAGRDLLTKIINHIREEVPSRPVVVMGVDCQNTEFKKILGTKPFQINLPWINSPNEIENICLGKISAETIVFIGIGSPKQEWLAQIIYEKTGAKCFCFGGAINMLEGRERPAPAILANNGLEWLYRLRTDTGPRTKRLLTSLPKGIFALRYASKITLLS